MKSYSQTVICPFCKKAHDRATSAYGGTRPGEGDFSLCFDCGEWAVFDGRGGLKKPTDAQYETLATDPDAVHARAAWLKVQEDRRQPKQPQQKEPPPSQSMFDKSFDHAFDAIYPADANPLLKPEVRQSLRRIFMAGALTCFQRVSMIGELQDEKEIDRRWQALKTEIAGICINTISTLKPKE